MKCDAEIGCDFLCKVDHPGLLAMLEVSKAIPWDCKAHRMSLAVASA